ncbi:MAG TPA: ATP-binding protein [Terriglobales bacterium]|nr:ATP-binding protein [Terriglobales bacterium]
MSSTAPQQRLRLVIGGVILTLLLAAVFTLGSLDVPFEPKSWRDVLTLYAVSSFVTAALIVFGLILTRTIFRLWLERRREELGIRFKTKMLVGAMGISLLPVVFMFFVSYSLLNRTLARWFPRPLEIAAEQSNNLLQEMGKSEFDRLSAVAQKYRSKAPRQRAYITFGDLIPCDEEADAFWLLKPDKTVDRLYSCEGKTTPPTFKQKLSGGAEIWSSDGQLYLAAGVPAADDAGTIYAARLVPPDFAANLAQIQLQTAAYEQEKQHLRALKRQLLLILGLFTVLLLSALMWLALHLAKQVTVPIQALAEGTREISTGNFDYQVPEQAQDELGVLVRSFNAMTTQLRDSRAQINEFTRSLQQAVQELERRRQLMETVLENIPTGVLSLDTTGKIIRSNAAISRIFKSSAPTAQTLDDLVGPEDARAIQALMRRALRMGVVTREFEMVAAGRVLHAAVTVSSLGPRRANTGYVVVLDDLTELLHAQKSAAWQEVARRIAHEIKNPLTPISLSAQRLAHHLEKRDPAESAAPRDPELTRLVQECSRLIDREVGALAALVNEFSQFVRFPSAKLEPADVNKIVREAAEPFSGRLDGVNLKTTLAENLPAVRADAGLLRSVVVNLIDNAAEALENSPIRNIFVSTRADADSENVEISVADTGHGISPQDKDKLFLPHFSTKDRGTGLGLAIAARIVAEHGGSIHVEDNSPVGSRFILRLPVSDPVPVPEKSNSVSV